MAEEDMVEVHSLNFCFGSKPTFVNDWANHGNCRYFLSITQLASR